MPNKNIPLYALGLDIPDMQFDYGGKQVIRPITDHPPIIQNTAWGAFATMNILNPGSKFAPPVKVDGVESLPPNGKVQMELMAGFIFNLFEKGVNVLALQEVPAPNSPNFHFLVNELERLNRRSNLLDVKALSKQWLQTGTHRFGTSVLYNPNHFSITQSATHALGNRAAVYAFRDFNTNTQIPVTNFHGDFTQQTATAEYISSFDGICLGDANLSFIPTANPPILQSVEIPTVMVNGHNRMLNTFDIFQDTYSKKQYPQFTPDIDQITQPPAIRASQPSFEPQVMQIAPNDAKPFLHHFSNYLVQNGKSHLIGNGLIKGLYLTTPWGSQLSNITIDNTEVYHACTDYIQQLNAVKFQPQVIQVPANDAKKFLDDFADYLVQSGQGNLVSAGRIKDISLTTPFTTHAGKRVYSDNASITFSDEEVYQSYQVYQQKQMTPQVPNKFIPCPGATSDHAWRSIQVALSDKQVIQGATWNMQMRCRSKADNGGKFANNPLDVTEGDKEYLERKRLQIDTLKEMIDRGNDFIFLQEADWIAPPGFDKANKNKLLSDFKGMLKQSGWEMIATPGKDYQMMVTLYNPQKLTPNPNKPYEGLFQSNKTGKFRGFQTNFNFAGTNNPIALVNLHLEYDQDYRQSILNQQKAFVERNIPCIMGGDTNNVQNFKLNSMIGDWNAATNIEAAPTGGLTTIHGTTEQGITIQKTYDGFFVNPTKSTSAIITEMPSKKFVDLGQGRVGYTDYIPNEQHKQHQARKGTPWQRQKDLPKITSTAQPPVAPPYVSTQTTQNASFQNSASSNAQQHVASTASQHRPVNPQQEIGQGRVNTAQPPVAPPYVSTQTTQAMQNASFQNSANVQQQAASTASQHRSVNLQQENSGISDMVRLRLSHLEMTCNKYQNYLAKILPEDTFFFNNLIPNPSTPLEEKYNSVTRLKDILASSETPDNKLNNFRVAFNTERPTLAKSRDNMAMTFLKAIASLLLASTVVGLLFVSKLWEVKGEKAAVEMEKDLDNNAPGL